MEKSIFGKLFVLAGFFPFIIAIIDGTKAATQTSNFDYNLFLNQILSYSAENWFTYLMGIALILVGINHELRK